MPAAEAIIGDAATVVGFNHLAILHAVDHENVQEGYRHLLEDADDSLLDLAALADVDAAHVTTSMLLVTRKMMEAMPKIKMIVRHGVGYDNVDLEAADELGVAICNVPDYGTEEVTDMAFTHTLGLLRGAYNHTKNVREGVWNTFGGWPGSGRIQRIRGLQVGLVGFGRMGKAYTIRAKAFGMEVQYFDPYRPQGEDKSMGVRACETLEELLRTSDVVNVSESSRAISRADYMPVYVTSVVPAAALRLDGGDAPHHQRGNAQADEADSHPCQHSTRRLRRHGSGQGGVGRKSSRRGWY